eukprot:Clim_evm13s200 gene=Clim_evmTU13s200
MSRTMFVIGAGDYIGTSLVRRFAKEGYKVCAARRRGELLNDLSDEINGKYGEGTFLGMSLDGRKEEEVQKAFDRVETELGPIDCAVYNIGGNIRFPIAETTSQKYFKSWEQQAMGGFLFGRAAAKAMLPRRKGTIIFTGATASMLGNPGYAAFAGGKFAVRALAQSMARELGPQGIHIAHVVIDSAVETEFTQDLIKKSIQKKMGGNLGEQELEMAYNQYTEGRVVKPDSVAEMYWYLHNQSNDCWTFEIDLRPYKEPMFTSGGGGADPRM